MEQRQEHAQRDSDVAKVYYQKRNMKLNEISNFADNLLRTRTQCEEQAQESLLMSDEHAKHIANLEA